jgi:hypothetical protein
MPHYKAPDNSVHFLDDAAFEQLLPASSVPITDEEADAIRPQPPAPTYRELRAVEYPAIGDQLDALFHAGVFPAEMAALIQAVKDKYPKG